MRRWAGLLLLLVLVALPGAVSAEPPAITLAEYRERLTLVVAHLEAGRLDAAREAAGTTWLVETPHGPVRADLRPLAGGGGPAAAEAARQHLEALALLEQSGAMAADPAARERLEWALNRAQSRSTLDQWMRDLFTRLFGREERGPAARSSSTAEPVLGVGALLISLAGIGLLAWGLTRSLGGYAGGDEAELAEPGGGRPSRPATPLELRATARRRSADGDHREALRLLLLASLQQLDKLGLLRYDPALTNREHERQLRRRHPALARTLRELNDAVERRLYAGVTASPDDFAHADTLTEQLWREGDAASKSAAATPGASSAV